MEICEPKAIQKTPERKPLGGNTATGLLKVIALVCMLCDHFGKMVFPAVPDLRVIGRIAFPLYCWCLVVGAHYTKSMPKYILRTFVLFVISQPFYMVALNHHWTDPNIFLTLTISLIGLWGLRDKRFGSQYWAPVIALVLALLASPDYGWKGVLLVMLLWGVRDSRNGIACVMTAFCFFWGEGSSTIKKLFGIPLDWMSKAGRFSNLLTRAFRTQSMAILALPMMLVPIGGRLKKWKMNKILSYCIYPAHLVLLILCELMLKNGPATVYNRLMSLVVEPVLTLFGINVG